MGVVVGMEDVVNKKPAAPGPISEETTFEEAHGGLQRCRVLRETIDPSMESFPRELPAGPPSAVGL